MAGYSTFVCARCETEKPISDRVGTFGDGELCVTCGDEMQDEFYAQQEEDHDEWTRTRMAGISGR